MLLLREWATDSLLTGNAVATFLVAENLNDLHPLLAANLHTARRSRCRSPTRPTLGAPCFVLDAGVRRRAGRLARGGWTRSRTSSPGSR